MYAEEAWKSDKECDVYINQIRVEIKAKEGVKLSGRFALNYVRSSFDTRHTNNNSIFISSLRNDYDYTGDLEYLKEKFYIDKLVTLNEGEFSLYADAVEKKIYKSSYHLDKPYELYNYYAEWGSNENEGKLNLKEIFQNIRKDNGLNNFSGNVKHFYNQF